VLIVESELIEWNEFVALITDHVGRCGHEWDEAIMVIVESELIERNELVALITDHVGRCSREQIEAIQSIPRLPDARLFLAHDFEDPIVVGR
jgi:hypothetical protein